MTQMIEVADLGMHYQNGRNESVAIERVTFDVDQGEFVCIVGPSGCGKTTLLKCIAGLLKPTSGFTKLAGRTVLEPPEDTAVVFQDYSRSLFQWLSVRRNVALPITRQSKFERDRIVQESLQAVGLERFASYHPWQLSGGMQQRVAIARALACRPKVLLMDEPFASVDALTRAELEDLVLRVRQEFSATVLLVTHDIDEAVYMSDRVVILSQSPAKVNHIQEIPLARPRNQVATKRNPEFGQLRTSVYTRIVPDGSMAVTQQSKSPVGS